MSQLSDFMIEACEMCDQFHRVAWYDLEGEEHLLCDRCLGNYECNVTNLKDIHNKSLKKSQVGN